MYYNVLYRIILYSPLYRSLARLFLARSLAPSLARGERGGIARREPGGIPAPLGGRPVPKASRCLGSFNCSANRMFSFLNVFKSFQAWLWYPYI